MYMGGVGTYFYGTLDINTQTHTTVHTQSTAFTAYIYIHGQISYYLTHDTKFFHRVYMRPHTADAYGRTP